MNLENFAKLRGLDHAYNSSNTQLLDQFLDSDKGDEIRKSVLTKRLQFDTTPQLYSEVESICSLLCCSKREFLVCDGINNAQAMFMAAFKDGSGTEFTDVYGVKEA